MRNSPTKEVDPSSSCRKNRRDVSQKYSMNSMPIGCAGTFHWILSRHNISK
jgi:hypothetical protein